MSITVQPFRISWNIYCTVVSQKCGPAVDGRYPALTLARCDFLGINWISSINSRKGILGEKESYVLRIGAQPIFL